jgi:exodeoxyribonuclease-1
MYIFYDTETSGLEKDFSQILQIALVFTDDDMNILSSKKIDCRRSPWVVPSPGALLTTGFTPDDLKNSKNTSYEMMHEVDQWLRARYWPVIFSGYNTLGYDEPVLSQNFHQNLLDPFLTTLASKNNGGTNSRSDMMVMVKAVVAYMPGALTLKTKNDFGSVSLSLINVAEQNGVNLSHEDAHDAMNDIKATIGVAKMLKKTAPQIWDQMTKLSSEKGVQDFLANNKLFTHAYVVYGKAQSAVATAVTTRPEDKTAVMFDLSYDPAPYQAMSVEELKDVILKQSERVPYGQPRPPKPFRMAQEDAQPILMPMDLSEAVIPAKFDEKVAEARADAIKADAQFRQKLAQAASLAYAAQNPGPAKPQPEQLMNTPLSAPTKAKLEQWMKEYNATTEWQENARLIDDFYTRFEDELKTEPEIRRYVQFAGRILFEHDPEQLSEDKREKMNGYIAAHILTPDLKVPQMTIAKARQELAQIEQERADGKARWAEVSDTQIRSLKLYYTAIEKEYAPYLKPRGVTPPENSARPDSAAPPANDDAQKPAADVKKSANKNFRP